MHGLVTSDYQFALGLAHTLDRADVEARVRAAGLPVVVIADDLYNIIAASDLALVTSGTATLECALLQCPMVIVYRLSPVTWALGRLLVRGVTHVGMPNIVAGREVECAVLEEPGGGLFVSRPGEIAPAASHGFYTYDAKYVDADGAALKVPAELPDDVEATVRGLAADAFRAVGCDGMARVDFFVTADMRILVNELNTIPGFTDISMYPKAMAASGVGYAELIDRLVEHARARAAG